MFNINAVGFGLVVFTFRGVVLANIRAYKLDARESWPSTLGPY